MLDTRSSGSPIKPLNTSGVKIQNKYVLLRERTLLLEAFIYGIFNPLQYEFTIPEHRILYSNIKNFQNSFPIDQYTLDSFLQYLSDTGSLQNCGGASFVRELFRGLGQDA